jgi:lipopolysaccharide export LptBFGC system permease protein LptF
MILNHKVILFWSIVTLMVCSISITLLSHNTLADSLSISFTVFASFALFFTAAMWLEDRVHEICNP